MVLLDSQPEKISEIMGIVKDSIVHGTRAVVENMKLEDKYQFAAMKSLAETMEHVG